MRCCITGKTEEEEIIFLYYLYIILEIFSIDNRLKIDSEISSASTVNLKFLNQAKP